MSTWLPKKLLNRVAAGSPNLAINGGMDSDTGWTKPSGVTIAGGVATFTAVAANAVFFQDNTDIDIGDYYLVEVDISGYVGGIAYLSLHSTTGASSRIIANGHFAWIMQAQAARIEFRNTTTATLVLDNISVRRLNPALFTFGAELLDPFSLANYSSANTLEDMGGWVKCTRVASDNGVTGSLSGAGILTANLVVGATYQLTGRVKKTATAGVAVLAVSTGYVTPFSVPMTTEWADFAVTFIGSTSTTGYIRAYTNGGTISNELQLYSCKRITQTELE